MSNLPVAFDFSQLPSTQVGSSAAFDDIAKSSDYQSRLQLYTKGAAIDEGRIKPGHYGIPKGKEKIVDLGETVDVLVLARRAKAVDMTDRDAIRVSYDSESDEFKRIAETSKEKESNCMYGVSFLIYERTTREFLEFYCGSKSAREILQEVYSFMPLSPAEAKIVGQEPHGPIPMTLAANYVKKGRFSWHAPEVRPCSTPFANVPDMATITKEIIKFVNVKNDGVETAPETAKKARAR